MHSIAHYSWYGLWYGGTALQLAVLILLVWRRLLREFPIFALYTAHEVLKSIALRFVPYGSNAAFYGYWANEAIDIILGIAIIYEIYRHVFKRYEALQSLGSIVFRWCLIVLTGVAFCLATMPSPGDTPVMRGVLVLGIGGTLIRTGLLLVLFIFASTFGLTWKHYAFGIAMGLAVYYSVDLANLATRIHNGSAGTLAFQFARMGAYCFALVLWVGYFATAENRISRIVTLPSVQLDQWNSTLTQLLHRT